MRRSQLHNASMSFVHVAECFFALRSFNILTIVFAGMTKECSPSLLSFFVILFRRGLQVYRKKSNCQYGKNYPKSQILAILWFWLYSTFFYVYRNDEVELLCKTEKRNLIS